MDDPDDRCPAGGARRGELLALRSNDGGTVRPRDEVLNAYAKSIGDVCASTRDSKISAVGATIYDLAPDLKP